MADLCTLPWLLVLTEPCHDCLPTLPDLTKKRDEDEKEQMGSDYKDIILPVHSYQTRQVLQIPCTQCKYVPLHENNEAGSQERLVSHNKSTFSSWVYKQ